mmetsp:Transcript_71773/g.149950  ORF Transcript_71773/g.149950 Transcript_71773/m.149950 type:complete len:200 (+) Transcript_71773:855-1454(+)
MALLRCVDRKADGLDHASVAELSALPSCLQCEVFASALEQHPLHYHSWQSVCSWADCACCRNRLLAARGCARLGVRSIHCDTHSMFLRTFRLGRRLLEGICLSLFLGHLHVPLASLPKFDLVQEGDAGKTTSSVGQPAVGYPSCHCPCSSKLLGSSCRKTRPSRLQPILLDRGLCLLGWSLPASALVAGRPQLPGLRPA